MTRVVTAEGTVVQKCGAWPGTPLRSFDALGLKKGGIGPALAPGVVSSNDLSALHGWARPPRRDTYKEACYPGMGRIHRCGLVTKISHKQSDAPAALNALLANTMGEATHDRAREIERVTFETSD